MVANVVENLPDESDCGAMLQQNPDHVVVIDAGRVSQKFDSTSDLLKLGLSQQKEVFEIDQTTREILERRRAAAGLPGICGSMYYNLAR